MAGDDLRERLRVATHEVHERLHQHRDFAAIADGSIRAPDFDRLMVRMGGFYAALDPVMSAACRGAVTAGYRYSARAPMFPRIAAGRPHLPPIMDLQALAGAAYVVDGSVLGGQLLRRAIGGRLSHPYWDWCAAEGPLIWRSTRALIDLAGRSPNPDHAVETAKAVFQAFSDHMDMATAEVPA